MIKMATEGAPELVRCDLHIRDRYVAALIISRYGSCLPPPPLIRPSLPITQDECNARTERPRPYQCASTQDTKKRYAKLPTSYLQRNNGRQTSPTVHLSTLRTRKISTYTKNWKEHFQLKQATCRREDHPPHAQLPQQDRTIQTHLRRYRTWTGEIKETLAQCALP